MSSLYFVPSYYILSNVSFYLSRTCYLACIFVNTDKKHICTYIHLSLSLSGSLSRALFPFTLVRFFLFNVQYLKKNHFKKKNKLTG